LRYQQRDQELVERTAVCADIIIKHNPIIRDRIDRYCLVPEFPEFLGGLDHPRSLLDGIQFDIPDVDRRIVVYLRDCSDDVLFDIKYHYISEEIDDESSQALRDILKNVVELFCQLPHQEDGTIVPLNTLDDNKLLDRSLYIGWAEYYRDIAREKIEQGLGSLDDIIGIIVNGFNLRYQLHGHRKSDQNPMIRLRNRREFLIARLPEEVEPHDFMWSDLRSVSTRISRCFQGRITPVRELLEVLGLDGLPMLTCPVTLSSGGVVDNAS
jgi:hypothetical protein